MATSKTTGKAQAKPAAKKAVKKDAKAALAKGTVLDVLGTDGLCQRLRAGESITGIAFEIGVAKSTLLDWIASDPDRSARTREARSMAAAMYDEAAEVAMTTLHKSKKAWTPLALLKK